MRTYRADTSVPPSLRRWRASLYATFVVFGLSLASWVTRTPAIRDAVGASTAEMGLLLLGLSIGSMAGVLSSGALVQRLGCRPVAIAGCASITLGMLAITVGAGTGSAPAIFLGLLLFGLGMGLSEIALNIEGAAVEKALGRAVLPILHGCFSLGTVVGALGGILATAVDVSPFWHLLAVTVAGLAIVAGALPGLPARTGQRTTATAIDPTRDAVEVPAAPVAPAATMLQVLRRPTVVLLGVLILGMALAEGAANDWLPLIMVDGHGLDPTVGSLVYTGFAVAMTTGRFAGAWFLDRFGRGPVLLASVLTAAVGIAGVVFSPSPVLAGVAVLFWGLGASLGFPVVISAAGDHPTDSAAQVSAVATAGYIAFLVGPPLLGLLGEHHGLRNAMLAVLALVVAAALVARPAMRVPDPAPADDDHSPTDRSDDRALEAS
ncbi:MFS transporter [Serinibacter arcticus]|uniref:MFS transporter n=1 Tax=Serinibacter arcticus TaxID=1655435 RepID=A0A2U1ZZF9_9MICO|nr:MFS transporter [Serinibacter arcticus]PWD52292.1 MFS transporter [Serinibacter arcticus]